MRYSSNFNEINRLIQYRHEECRNEIRRDIHISGCTIGQYASQFGVLRTNLTSYLNGKDNAVKHEILDEMMGDR